MKHQMLVAVCEGKIDEIEKYLKKGYPVDEPVDRHGKYTPASLAAYLDKLEVLHFLDLNGADIVSAKGKFGFTPLLTAQSRWNVKIIDYLIERGVNPFVKDNFGFTAKQKALLNEHKTIYSMLNQYESEWELKKRGNYSTPVINTTTT
jgi:ankyrin repeat protein